MTTRAIHVPTLPPGVDVLLSVSSLLKEKVIMAALQRQESATMWLNFLLENERISKTIQVPLSDNLFRIRARAGIDSSNMYNEPTFAPTEDRSATTLHTVTDTNFARPNWIKQTAGMSKSDLAMVAHRVMGHAGNRPISNLHVATVGLPTPLKLPDAITHNCDSCLKAKLTRTPISKMHEPRSLTPGALVNADIQQVSILGHGGMKMRLNYVCDFSGAIFTHSLKSKADTAKTLPKLKQVMGVSPRHIVTDGGGEFQGRWEDQATKLGISFYHGPRDASVACNPKAERANLTIDTLTNAFMSEAGFTGSLHRLWPYVDQQSALVHSMTPQERFSYKCTPFERLYNTKPDISHLNVVGARCYVINNRRKNGEYHGVIAYLLHDERCGGSKVMYYPKTNSVIRSKDVVVDNKHLFKNDYRDGKQLVDLDRSFSVDGDMRFSSADANVKEVKQNDPPSTRSTTRKRIPPGRYDPSTEAEKPQWQKRRRTTTRQPSKTLRSRSTFLQRFLVFAAVQHIMISYVQKGHEFENFVLFNKPQTRSKQQYVPKSPKEAWKDPDWRDAMMQEYNAMFAQGVVELCDKSNMPKDSKLFNGMWIFTVKDDGTYKARLVANGSYQPQGDYYSPTIPTSLVRIFLGLAASQNYDIATADVSRAFLNADLPKAHYMRIPACMPGTGDQVLLVKKALYGFREAPKLWNKTVTEFLNSQDITQSKYHPCVFYGEAIYLIFHVDDFLFVGNADKIDTLMQSLFERFPGKRTDIDDSGTILQHKKFLKLNIQVTPTDIRLSAGDTIKKTLEASGIHNLYPKKVPMSQQMQDKVADATGDPQYTKKLQEIVGALLYIATVCRPDIMYAVAFLARYTHIASETALDAATDVLRYLHHTKEECISRTTRKDLWFETYVDAGSQCKHTGRWTSGYELFLNGVPIHWKSKRQNLCALSSCEAELIALSEATVETLFYRRLLCEMNLIDESATHIYCDNASTIDLVTQDYIRSGRSKHIDIKHFFTREQHREFKTVQVLYVPTASNKADGMTKALARTKHGQFRDFLFHRQPKQQRLSNAFSPRILLSALHECSAVRFQAQLLLKEA